MHDDRGAPCAHASHPLRAVRAAAASLPAPDAATVPALVQRATREACRRSSRTRLLASWKMGRWRSFLARNLPRAQPLRLAACERTERERGRERERERERERCRWREGMGTPASRHEQGRCRRGDTPQLAHLISLRNGRQRRARRAQRPHASRTAQRRQRNANEDSRVARTRCVDGEMCAHHSRTVMPHISPRTTGPCVSEVLRCVLAPARWCAQGHGCGL